MNQEQAELVASFFCKHPIYREGVVYANQERSDRPRVQSVHVMGAAVYGSTVHVIVGQLGMKPIRLSRPVVIPNEFAIYQRFADRYESLTVTDIITHEQTPLEELRQPFVELKRQLEESE